jgi:hypothetical protein
MSEPPILIGDQTTPVLSVASEFLPIYHPIKFLLELRMKYEIHSSWF